MPPVSAAPAAARRLPRFVVGVFVVIGLLMALLLLAAGFLAITAVTTDSVERRARTFPAVEQLRVRPGSGDVTIRGERREDVRVDMRIHHNMWRNDWQPGVEMRGDLLWLDNECAVWTVVAPGQCGASFTIRVPRATAVALVGGGSSDVRVERLAGALDVATGSGDVEVDGYRGAVVTVTAGSGDVELESLRTPRRVWAQAGSGDVAITVPHAAYRVDVHTGSGDEDVQVADDPRSDRSIDVRTGSGDVELLGR